MRGETRVRSSRALAALVVAAGAVTWSTGVPFGPVMPVGADEPDCEVIDAGGQCRGANQRPGSSQPGDGPASRGPLTCELIAFADQEYGLSLFPPPDNPLRYGDELGGLIVWEDCGRPEGNGRYDPWERVAATGALPGFVGPAVVYRPVAWADPAEIAAARWAEVVATLPPPDLVVSPPQGDQSILEVPAFVAVGNWPGRIGPIVGRDGPVLIELTAVPTLVFDPGDGSDKIYCEGAGTVYDPEGPDPDVQADGACVHIYERHTSGEPWPGTVAIEWEVWWTSETPADEGVIPVTPNPVPLPREVDEVRGVVVDAGE